MHTGKILAAVITAAFSSGAALAQVQVVDPVPSGGYRSGSMGSSAVAYPSSSPVQAGSGSTSSSNAQADLFFEIQALRENVLELRGLVEEQAHEIKQLKQQRLDDYMDLDKRLSALSKGVRPAPSSAMTPAAASLSDSDSSSVGISAAETPVAPVSSSAPVGDEMQQYRAAIDAVLKQKDYQKAIAEFNGYLSAFPDGRYVPNSQYWLGEIYLLQGELEQSKKWFSALAEEYPLHDKTPDAKYKLGTVYHKLGDKAKAQQILTEVAGSSASAARLAQDYLSTNLK